MNTDNLENKLKELFSESRAQDSQRAPSFDALIRAASPAPSVRWEFSAGLWFAVKMAAVILLIGGVALAAVRLRARLSEGETRQWEMLSEWEAPTDALLNISGSPWGSSIAAPSDSLIHAASDSPNTDKESL